MRLAPCHEKLDSAHHFPFSVGESGFGVAFTNRPLMDNELFEVTLDRKTTNFPHAMAIGVSPHSPNDITINKFITDLKPPSWSMYYADLYYNNTVSKKNYGRTLDALVEGDRVGMMRRDTGTLHYFINGVDQGAAATGIPSSVYGLIELYGSAAMATIVSKSDNNFALNLLKSYPFPFRSNTWMMYNEDIYVDGNRTLSKYGKNLANLQVGDRVGVMRKSNGQLHIFINGVDQGIAASDVPKAVYGVVDIIRDTISVTIV
ncbi:neuralized-like protein 4 [Hetaerina americana]|uniref:neuralized-like protein 4 n=1 Tax=Hetaerina americana TaxID=62018 RepID=UPI003A7F5B1C